MNFYSTNESGAEYNQDNSDRSFIEQLHFILKPINVSWQDESLYWLSSAYFCSED